MLKEVEKEKLQHIVGKTAGIINFSKISDKIENKKIIIWGTSHSYKRFRRKNNIEIEFFIDSDIQKHGKELDGKLIYPPQKLLEINKDEYYVLVLSQFYLEIYEQLKSYGFEYKENFY